MRPRAKRKRRFIEAAAIIAIFVAVIVFFLGLRFFLGTDLPLIVVASGSMHPALEVGDVVVVQGVEATQIKQDDIIVFSTLDDNDTTQTVHRVIGIQTLPNGTRAFTTKGDNNTSADSSPVIEDQIHGRVVFRIPLVGYVALDPILPLAIIIIALIVILVWPERQRKRKHLHRKRLKLKIWRQYHYKNNKINAPFFRRYDFRGLRR